MTKRVMIPGVGECTHPAEEQRGAWKTTAMGNIPVGIRCGRCERVLVSREVRLTEKEARKYIPAWLFKLMDYLEDKNDG